MLQSFWSKQALWERKSKVSKTSYPPPADDSLPPTNARTAPTQDPVENPSPPRSDPGAPRCPPLHRSPARPARIGFVCTKAPPSTPLPRRRADWVRLTPPPAASEIPNRRRLAHPDWLRLYKSRVAAASLPTPLGKLGSFGTATRSVRNPQSQASRSPRLGSFVQKPRRGRLPPGAASQIGFV